MYIHTEDIHNVVAPKEVVPLILSFVNPATSVLDVGCGTGTWLKVFEQFGVKDYLGIDGAYVNKNLLEIPPEKFRAQDLRQEWDLNKKFDLVLSLEVAEHLEEEFADLFIRSLVKHGEVIVFSAAIPKQGGQNHYNEQWLSYWAAKFEKQKYRLYDVLRPKIWTNTKVDIWYRQNMVVFCKDGHPLQHSLRQVSSGYMDVVHPHYFTINAYHAERAKLYEEGKLGVQSALGSLFKAVRNKLGF